VYGVAWLFVVGIIVVLGITIGLIFTASPLFAFLLILVAALCAPLYFTWKRAQIGPERERSRARREELARTAPSADARHEAAPVEGEGSTGADGGEGKGYEPAT
jgi:hypothetical protein